MLNKEKQPSIENIIENLFCVDFGRIVYDKVRNTKCFLLFDASNKYNLFIIFSLEKCSQVQADNRNMKSAFDFCCWLAGWLIVWPVK